MSDAQNFGTGCSLTDLNEEVKVFMLKPCRWVLCAMLMGTVMASSEIKELWCLPHSLNSMGEVSGVCWDWAGFQQVGSRREQSQQHWGKAEQMFLLLRKHEASSAPVVAPCHLPVSGLRAAG